MWIVGLALATPPEFAPILEDPAFEEQFLGTILVTRGDETRLAVSRGVDRAGRLATDETVYWVGSISKSAAAALVLDLLDGRSLDEPVAAFLPEWEADALRRDGVDCTLRWLLSHGCGLPRDVKLRGDVHADPRVERAFLDAVRSSPLEFVPGTSYAYTNVGYTLAGVIASRLGGAPYCELVARRVFAGLSATGCDPGRFLDLADRIAPGHLDVPWGAISSERWLQIPWDAPASVGASGNVFSTAPELGRWFRALVRGDVLGSEATAAMLATQREEYGLGVIVDERKVGRVIWHNGALSPHGHNAFVGHLPETDTTVVVLLNRGRELVSATAIGLALVDRSGGRDRRSPFETKLGAFAAATLPGLVFVLGPILAVGACLAAPFRVGANGLVGRTFSVVTATSVFVFLQAMLDRFRPGGPWPLAFALLLEIGVLTAMFRRGKGLPLSPGTGSSTVFSGLLGLAALGWVAFVVDAELGLAAVVAVAVVALTNSARQRSRASSP